MKFQASKTNGMRAYMSLVMEHMKITMLFVKKKIYLMIWKLHIKIKRMKKRVRGVVIFIQCC